MRSSILSFIVCLLSFNLAVSAAALVPRIIGGQPASKADFGFVAYIEFFEPKSGKAFSFDGNLIAPNIVLTYISPSMTSDNVDNTTQFYRVAFPYKYPEKHYPINGHKVNQIILHPNSDKSKPYANIALMVLADNVASSEAVPTKVFTGSFSPGSWIRAAGYGITNPHDGGSNPAQLMETDIDLGTQSYCSNSNGKYTPDIMLCSKPGNGHDTCGGDWGGPLAVTTSPNAAPWALLGTFIFKFGVADSQGSFCAYSGSNTYYTYVKPFVDWISQETKLDPKDFTVGGTAISKNDNGNGSSSSNTDSSSSNDNGNSSTNGLSSGEEGGIGSEISGHESGNETSSTETDAAAAASKNSEDHSQRNTIIAAVCGSIGGLLLAILGFYVLRWWRNHMRYVKDPTQENYSVRDMLADDLNVAGMAHVNRPMNSQSIINPNGNHNVNFIGIMEHDAAPMNLPPAYETHKRPPTRDLEANKK